jgi:hypothetical protein
MRVTRASQRIIKQSETPEKLTLSLLKQKPEDVTPVIVLEPPKLNGPIEVQTNIQIFRLHKIDNSTEEFTIDMAITFMWEDPYLAYVSNGVNFSSHPSIFRNRGDPEIKNGNFQLWPDDLQLGTSIFDPAWKIQNASSIDIVKSISVLKDPSTGFVHNFIHLTATIFHTLDMHMFPFDSQTFTVNIRSEHPSGVMKFIPFRNGRPPKVFDTDSSEWKVDPLGYESMKLIFSQNAPAAASGMNMCFNSVCTMYSF